MVAALLPACWLDPGLRWCVTFLGRRLVDALIDLPFAMPTAVSGIACAPSSPQRLDRPAAGAVWHPARLATPAVVIALTFIGLLFVVRTLQPVLREVRPNR